MSNDTEKLTQYVKQGSESAFAELVHEHLNLVYSAALREADGDTGLAEDIAQEVFTELARHSRRLLAHPCLAGWLYTAVRHRAANLRRANQRRRQREEAAEHMNENTGENAGAVWEEIRPVLDDALHELSETDRRAILLRFLEERPLREVGASLGVDENTARMRVSRALDKLRGLLAARGISSSAAGLTAALAAGAIVPAPSAFAATVAGTALASTAVAGSATLTAWEIMTLGKVKLALGTALLVTGIAVPVWQQSRLTTARSEVAQLRSQETELASLREEAAQWRQVKTDQAELERLRQYQAQTQPELLRLRGMAGVARRANAEAADLRGQLSRQALEGGSNTLPGPMGDLMRLGMEQQVSNRLSKMTAMVRLTPDQVQAISDIMKRQAQISSAGVQQVMSGKFNKQELEDLAKNAGNPEQQIKALLSPEQLTAYQAYKEEETADTARLSAHMELIQMQTALSLNPEQQDQVFGAVYDVTMAQLKGNTNAPHFTNSADQMQWAWEQKAKALEPLLNPLQLAAYRQQQQAQLAIVKEIASKMRQ